MILFWQVYTTLMESHMWIGSWAQTMLRNAELGEVVKERTAVWR